MNKKDINMHTILTIMGAIILISCGLVFLSLNTNQTCLKDSSNCVCIKLKCTYYNSSVESIDSYLNKREISNCSITSENGKPIYIKDKECLKYRYKTKEEKCNEEKLIYDCHMKSGNYHKEEGYYERYINCTGSSGGVFVRLSDFLNYMIDNGCAF